MKRRYEINYVHEIQIIFFFLASYSIQHKVQRNHGSQLNRSPLKKGIKVSIILKYT